MQQTLHKQAQAMFKYKNGDYRIICANKIESGEVISLRRLENWENITTPVNVHSCVPDQGNYAEGKRPFSHIVTVL